jgi:hypothetical protein
MNHCGQSGEQRVIRTLTAPEEAADHPGALPTAAPDFVSNRQFSERLCERRHIQRPAQTRRARQCMRISLGYQEQVSLRQSETAGSDVLRTAARLLLPR